jgi:hypothetical protein
MTNAAKYSVVALCATDARSKSVRSEGTTKPNFLAPSSASARSRCIAVSSAQSGTLQKEIEFFVNLDFVSHVALVATVEEGNRTVIVGGGRYVIVQPGTAEVAFAVRRGPARQYPDVESVRAKRAPLQD